MRLFLIKLTIGIAGLVVLVKFGAIDFTVLMKGADRSGLLVFAFLCILATVPIGALRWWLLLRGLQFTFTLSWALSTTFISQFFNTFLPGAYGGDLVRLAMAYRATGTALNRLTLTVLTDRLTGLFALLMLGVAVLPALPVAYASRLEWLAVGGVALGIAGLALVLSSGELLARLIGRLPAPFGPALAPIVRESVGALRAYVAQPWRLIAAIVISLVQYVFALAALIVLGHAMRFEGLSWPGYVVAGAWSLVANALPITPGGIGLGEAAFSHVAVALSTPTSQGVAFGTVFLAMRVLTVVIGIAGLLPWMLHRTDLRSGLASIKTVRAPERRAPPTGQ